MAISYEQVYDSIGTMLNSGLDIKESLNTSAKGAKKELHDAIITVKKSIEKGDTLAKAFRKQSRMFPLMDRTLIDVGEQSGRLPHVFKSMADWYRFKKKMSSMIMSGLNYPMFNLGAAAVIMPLPLLFSATVSKYFYSVFANFVTFFVPPILLIMFYLKASKQGSLRIYMEKICLKIPLVGHAIWNLSLGRYCFGFWMLYESGVSIEKCAQIAAELSENKVISDMLIGGKKSAQQGNPVSAGFSRELPGDFISIFKVGEVSGKLGETLKKLYKNHIERAEIFIKEVSAWVPRIVWAIVAIYMASKIISFWSSYFGAI